MQGEFYEGVYEVQCLPAVLTITGHSVDAVSSITVE